MKLPVIGTSFAHGRSAVTAREAVNVWFERRGEGEKAPVIVSHLPGTELLINQGGVLGAWSNPAEGHCYVHTADTLYYILPVTGSVLASVSLPHTAIRPIEMCGTRDRVLFISGLSVWSVTPTLPSAPVLVDFPAGQSPLSCAWLGGYFWVYTTYGRIYWSANGVDWDPLDFANSEALSDTALWVRTIGDRLVLIGRRTIEFWGATGNAALPYRLIPGSVVYFQLETNGLRQLAQLGSRLFMWGSADGGRSGLFELRDTAMVRVTNPDIEEVGDQNLISISAFEEFGRPFVLVYRNGLVSWLVDVDMGVASRIQGGAYAGHVTFLADRGSQFVANSSGLYRMDRLMADPVLRRITTDNLVSPDLDRFSVDKVRLDVQADSVSMSVSRDGGATFGAPRSKSASAARGVRGAVQFDRYGTASQFTFRVESNGSFILSNIIINPRN